MLKILCMSINSDFPSSTLTQLSVRKEPTLDQPPTRALTLPSPQLNSPKWESATPPELTSPNWESSSPPELTSPKWGSPRPSKLTSPKLESLSPPELNSPERDSSHPPASLPRSRRRQLSKVLPTLRLLLRPTYGVGLDARMPFNKHVRCSMSLESYFNGISTVRFGFEPTKLSFIRLQVAPEVQLSIRIPIFPFSKCNRFYGGSQLTLLSNGQRPTLNTTGLHAFWKGIESFVKPVAEVQRQTSIKDLLLSKKNKRALHDLVEKSRTLRNKNKQDKQAPWNQMLEEYGDTYGLDSKRKEAIRKRVMEDLRHRFGKRQGSNAEIGTPSRAFGEMRMDDNSGSVSEVDPTHNGSHGKTETGKQADDELMTGLRKN